MNFYNSSVVSVLYIFFLCPWTDVRRAGDMVLCDVVVISTLRRRCDVIVLVVVCVVGVAHVGLVLLLLTPGVQVDLAHTE